MASVALVTRSTAPPLRSGNTELTSARYPSLSAALVDDSLHARLHGTLNLAGGSADDVVGTRHEGYDARSQNSVITVERQGSGTARSGLERKRAPLRSRGHLVGEQ